MKVKVITNKKEQKIAAGTLKPSNHWRDLHWELINDIQEIHIVKSLPKDIEVTVRWDPTVEQTGKVMACRVGQVLYICINGHDFVYANEDSSWMFSMFNNICCIEGLDLIDTSKVKTFRGAFSQCGFDEKNCFWLVGLDNWDVSNVIDMSYMFTNTGHQADNWTIGNLSKWNTKSVQNMRGMFSYCGVNTTIWSIGDLGKWDVHNVTDMAAMFCEAGKLAKTWFAGNLGPWNTHNVTNMSWMFASSGSCATNFNVGRLDLWDVSNVTEYKNFFSAHKEPKWYKANK